MESGGVAVPVAELLAGGDGREEVLGGEGDGAGVRGQEALGDGGAGAVVAGDEEDFEVGNGLAEGGLGEELVEARRGSRKSSIEASWSAWASM